MSLETLRRADRALVKRIFELGLIKEKDEEHYKISMRENDFKAYPQDYYDGEDWLEDQAVESSQ
jgi:hypothetical protein